MTTAVKAIYEDGVFKPKEPVELQEKTEVEVLIPTPASAQDDPTGWKAMREFIGLAGESAGGDRASEEHDKIVYRR
jgi:predicted DNA-binding antitoxin AbrB/MazE fold protein